MTKIRLQWSIDLRYGRQVHQVTTPVNARTPLDDAGVQQTRSTISNVSTSGNTDADRPFAALASR